MTTTTTEAVAPDFIEAPETANVTTETEDTATVPDPDTGGDGANDENKPWPKKAKNALSHRDATIKSLKFEKKQRESQFLAELNAVKERLAKFETTGSNSQQKQEDTTPKESDYASYHEYMLALQKDATRKETEQAIKTFAETQRKEAEEAQKMAQRQHWEQERSYGVKTAAEEFLKATPGAAAVLQEYGDWEFPDHIQQVFLEADPKDTVTAFYNLAQQGKLEELAHMSPIQAAMAISRASVPVQQATKAPSPMASAKGTNSFNTLATKTPDQLAEWLKT